MDSGSEAGMTMPAPETPIAEAITEAPVIETPTPSPTPNASASQETPPHGVLPFSNTDDREENLVAPKTEESPRTQQGTAQLESTPTQESPASPPESLPAPAPTIAIPSPQNIVGLILTKARLIIQLRKQKKLNKVMGLFLTKSKITNDEVEKLLHVSDATATRYLSELEKQGKIIQSGKTGHAVTYTKR
jgi:predicted HTH transcriptional regulator